MTKEKRIVMKEVMLTTFDNPFDPFEQFDEWEAFDEEKGYCSCSLLARIAKTSDQLTEKQNAEEIERAIDEIIKYDFTNSYKKLVRDSNETQFNRS